MSVPHRIPGSNVPYVNLGSFNSGFADYLGTDQFSPISDELDDYQQAEASRGLPQNLQKIVR